MTAKDLREKWSNDVNKSSYVYWDHALTNEYLRWLEDKYLELINCNNFDKPIFSQTQKEEL